MALLATVGGVLVFSIFAVLLVVRVSRSLGRKEAEARQRRIAAEQQARLARILARRNRSRSELIDWMREQSIDGRDSALPQAESDGSD